MARLTRSFFERPVLDVAPELLGCVVSHGGVSIRLTEVEAYDGERDPGSHAFRGQTPRNGSMFGPGGTSYVYFTYGMHWCCNLACGPEGRASAVLLRAGEVVTGHEIATARRNGCRPRDLARGPARLAQALGLSREHDGIVTTDARAALTVTSATDRPPALIRTGPRVGVSGPGGDAATYPWRFWIEGEPTVSTYRPAKPRRPRSS